MNGDFQYQYFSSVAQCDVDWLWYPYIPYGKITVLQGDPGDGKSTFILNVAALITRGRQMPDGFPVPSPQKVIYQTAEDSIYDTVKPRLIEARADCDKVAYIVDSEDPLTIADKRIENVLAQTGARLFILDPLQGYLSQDTDMANISRMRRQLRYLANVAAKYRCAVVIVGHMNKTSNEKVLYRGLGSIDIVAIARSVLMITRDKDNPSIRYMIPVKSSLAPEGNPIAFSLSKAGFRWVGNVADKSHVGRETVIVDTKKEMTMRVLRNILVDYDVPSKYILSRLKSMNISERTINAAKKSLGVISYRTVNEWYWHLPNDQSENKYGG